MNRVLRNCLAGSLAWMSLFCFSICEASAQDFEAFERRLGGAVESGEISLEQASLMMEVLKKSAKEKSAVTRAVNIDLRKKRFLSLEKELDEAVREGKINKQQAAEKLDVIRKELFGSAQTEKKRESGKKEDAKKASYMAGVKRMEEAVKAGKVSKEAAEKRLIEMRKKMFGAPSDRKLESADKKTVERKADAERMEALKKQYMAGAKQIEEAVKAGKVSKEAAEKRLIEMRKRMFGDSKGDRDSQKNLEEKKKRDLLETRNRRLEAARQNMKKVAEDLKKAVEAGRMSKAEAAAKMKRLMAELGEKKR